MGHHREDDRTWQSIENKGVLVSTRLVKAQFSHNISFVLQTDRLSKMCVTLDSS